MRILATAIAAALLAACGTDNQPAGSPEDVARAWVDAVNARDWDEACSLSDTQGWPSCTEDLPRSLRDVEGMQVEGLYTSGETTKFTVTTAQTRGETPPEEDGWTAYAPLELAVIERDGRHLVDFEIIVIR